MLDVLSFRAVDGGTDFVQWWLSSGEGKENVLI